MAVEEEQKREGETEEQKQEGEKEEQKPDVKAWRLEGLDNWRSQNIVDRYNLLNWGSSKQTVKLQSYVRKCLVERDLSTFDALGQATKFKYRITSISWHPTLPYLMAAADKHGAIILCNGHRSNESQNLQFDTRDIMGDNGPGGAIFSMKWLANDPASLFTASLDGTVSRRNVDRPKLKPKVFFDTKDYSHWLTAMDLSQSERTVVAGDTKGYVRFFSIDGQPITTIRLHNNKIRHCEFNTRVPWLISTASLQSGQEVCLWDTRKLQDSKPLHVLPHNKGTNIACFNPLDGSRLLTTDQKDQICVFEAPLWNNTLELYHPHRQFQHLTAIEADWHTLSDTIVVGRYPTEIKEKGQPAPLRPIEFFDADNGKMISQLNYPGNLIVSLNKFNVTGEILASSMGGALVFWEGSRHLEELYGGKKKYKTARIMTTAQRNALRGGVIAEEEEEKEDIDKIKKRKKSKANTGGKNKKAKLMIVHGKRSKSATDSGKNVKLSTGRGRASTAGLRHK